jgi:hypothetical protein
LLYPKLVQHLLGHASITMTLDRYSHWLASCLISKVLIKETRYGYLAISPLEQPSGYSG